MRTKLSFFCTLAFLLAVLSACHPFKKEIPTGSPFKLDNVYASPTYDHGKIVKALMLPIDNPRADDGVVRYEKEFISASLKNFGKFNYFFLQYDQDFSKIAQANDAIDVKTGKFHRMKLGEIAREYQAQALIKVSVSEFRPFFPMFIKVKASMIDVQTGEVVWVIDQVFDASDADIVNGMRMWWNSTKAGGNDSLRFNSALNRPSAFLDYVFYSLAKSYGDVRARNLEAIDSEQRNASKNRAELSNIQQPSKKTHHLIGW